MQNRRSAHGVGQYDRHIFNLSQEAALLEERLAVVTQEKSRVSIARDRASNHLLPIGRLADEILSEVLHYAVSDLAGEIWASSALATCYRWRRCILNTPKIWATVHITERSSPGQLDRWFQLSAHAPLKIQIDYSGYDPPVPEYKEEKVQFPRLWKLVEARAARVYHLCISALSSTRSILPIPKTFTSLRRLEVRELYSYNEFPCLPVLADGGPQSLESLCVMGESEDDLCYDSLSVDIINSSQLRSLTLSHHFHVDRVWLMIPHFQALEKLKWLARPPDEVFKYEIEQRITTTSGHPFSGFTLPNLKVVEVRGVPVLPFLRYACMPRLQSLTVESPDGDMSTLLPCLLRHNTVQELCVRNVLHTEVDQLRSIFRNFGGLVHFGTDGWTKDTFDTAWTLAELCFVGAGKPSVLHSPHLHALSLFTRWGFNPSQFDELNEGLKQRILPAIDEREKGQGTSLIVYIPDYSHKNPVNHPRLRYGESFVFDPDMC